MSRSGTLLLLLALVLGAALPALANVSVSTTDGVTLTLTNAGAFSSMTVNGNTVPTLAGVNGGFYIVPMDGVVIDTTRHTYYPGTQITGTATQNGSNMTITGDGPEPDLQHHPHGWAALPQGGRDGDRQWHRPLLPGGLSIAGECERLDLVQRCREWYVRQRQQRP